MKITRTFAALVFMLLSTSVLAQDQERIDKEKMVNELSSRIISINNAARIFYSKNKGWPASLQKLEASGHLSSDFGVRSGITTAVNENGQFLITLTLSNDEGASSISKYVAAKVNGVNSGNKVTLTTSPPVGFIDPNLYVDRINPKSMGSDININSKWIEQASIQGNVIDVSQVKGETLEISRDATVARHVLISGQLMGVGANLSNALYQSNVNAQTVTAATALQVNGKVESSTTLLKGGATLQENAVFNSPATANGSLQINNSLKISGTTVFNNLAIFQSLTFTDMLTAAGGITGTQATFQQGLIDQVQANQAITNDADVKGDVLAKDIRASDIYALNGEFSGNLNTLGLITKGNVKAINGLYVGTDNVMVADRDGNLYQRGKQLDQVYLGKDAKAADAALLDGMSASELSVLTQDRIFSQSNIFNGLVQFNSIGYAGGKKFIDPATGQLSEAGQTLDSRYLGINAKAADTALLDGLAATAFGQLAAANTFSQRVTFTQGLRVNGNLSSGGSMVASNGQWFEGGQALTLRYLGINGKAADTALLDGLSSGQLARKDTNNTFTGSNTFSQDVTVGGQALLGSVRAVESRTSSLEGRVASTNSQLDNLLYIKSRCKVHAKDPGCQFVFIPKQTTPAGQGWLHCQHGQSCSFNNRLTYQVELQLFGPKFTVPKSAIPANGYSAGVVQGEFLCYQKTGSRCNGDSEAMWRPGINVILYPNSIVLSPTSSVPSKYCGCESMMSEVYQLY
ncbi:TPA: hypothetical protein RQN23_000710 [Aeromonas veronii]|nr:hypothetical protein [Aeromonas veronii]